MKQKGQRFDTQALTQEAQALTRDVVSAPFRLRTYRLIRKILIGFILVSIANVLFSYFFYTPKMYRIIRDNRDLVIKYRILQDRIRRAQQRVRQAQADERQIDDRQKQRYHTKNLLTFCSCDIMIISSNCGIYRH